MVPLVDVILKYTNKNEDHAYQKIYEGQFKHKMDIGNKAASISTTDYPTCIA